MDGLPDVQGNMTKEDGNGSAKDGNGNGEKMNSDNPLLMNQNILAMLGLNVRPEMVGPQDKARFEALFRGILATTLQMGGYYNENPLYSLLFGNFSPNSCTFPFTWLKKAKNSL